MMRELQILASGMDVEVLAIDIGCHDRALDVPTGSSGTPLAVPGRLARLGLLPKGEVVRAPFLRVLGRQRPLALLHLLRCGAQRWHQLPVVVAHLLEGGNVEVDAASRRVRHALLFKLLDELLDAPVHVLGDPCHDVWPQNAKGVHVLEVLLFEMPTVGIKNGVVGHCVAPLFVKLLHQHFPRGCQDRLRLAGLQGRLDFLLQLGMLAQLQLVLLQGRGVLLLVFARGICGRSDWGLRRQLITLRVQGCIYDLLQVLQLHVRCFLGEVIEELVLPCPEDDLVIDIRDVDLVLHIEAEIVRHYSS
mmetsp:Transcript_28625/g.66321  ORF Transcript_28625/g.66321 Transcript_28625/m.66321 type:complete len:304 (+) Transcript_28625:471-1382(+)